MYEWLYMIATVVFIISWIIFQYVLKFRKNKPKDNVQLVWNILCRQCPILSIIPMDVEFCLTLLSYLEAQIKQRFPRAGVFTNDSAD